MISSDVTAAYAALQAAVASVGALQNASQQTLSPISTAVTALLAAIDAQTTALEATIDQSSVGGIHVGTPAPQLAATLVAQAQAVTDLAALQAMRGYAARIGINIANAPG